MHAIIYGSGKWAQLISNKLQNNNVENLLVGNNITVTSVNKFAKIPSSFYGGMVFIASATKDHFSDLKQCLTTNPKTIFLEKGFSDAKLYNEAKKLSSVPIYILSQYRYSEVIRQVKNLKIKKIEYNWKVDSDTKEWMYHIYSIDNFIKKQNNRLPEVLNEHFTIDNISSGTISSNVTRNLEIKIITEKDYAKINLGKTNSLDYGGKHLVFDNEDCLGKQINGILNNYNLLERL